MTEKGSLNSITVSTMTLPHLYCCLGTFCQMFFTNGKDTLSGSPIILSADFANGHHKKFFHPTVMDHDRGTHDFSIHPKELKALDKDFVIMCADRETPLYCFDFVLKFSNLERAWKESENGSCIQIFDVSFEPQFQRYKGHEFFKMNATETDIIFNGHLKFLHTVGIIKSRHSMSIEEYREMTGYDPIFQYIQQEYIAHLELQVFCQKEGDFSMEDTNFNAFYEQQVKSLRLNEAGYLG